MTTLIKFISKSYEKKYTVYYKVKLDLTWIMISLCFVLAKDLVTYAFGIFLYFPCSFNNNKILSLLSLFLGMISHHKCSAFFIVIPTKELLDVLLLENICVNWQLLPKTYFLDVNLMEIIFFSSSLPFQLRTEVYMYFDIDRVWMWRRSFLQGTGWKSWGKFTVNSVVSWTACLNNP